MAPTSCRHTLIWSLPTLAILLTFLWYKSRRGSSRSDPGGTAKGTRKAKKQEQKITRVTPSLLAEGSEASVKKSICAKRTEQVEFRNCPPTTETVDIELGHPKVQQSEINIVAKTVEKSNVEATVPPSRKNFCTDTSKNIFIGQNSENSCAVVVDQYDINTDYKNQLLELAGTSIHSAVQNTNSEITASSEENSVSGDSFSVDCVEEKQTFVEIIEQAEAKSDIAVSRRKNFSTAVSKETNSVTAAPKELTSVTKIANSVTQEINSQVQISQETNCKSSERQESFEIGLLKEISSEIAFPLETDSKIRVISELTGEIGVYDTKETNYKITNSQDIRYSIGGPQETGPKTVALNERDLEIAVVKEPNSEVAVVKEPNSEVAVVKEPNSEVAVVKETNSEVAVVEETNSEVAVVEETNSEVAVVKETNSEVAVLKETNFEVAVPKKTNFEVVVPKETNSVVAVPKEANSDIVISKETNSKIIGLQAAVSGVAVRKEINSDITISQETHSDIDSELFVSQRTDSDRAVLQEKDSDIVAPQETTFEITVAQGEDSKVTVTEETHSEVTVSQDSNPEDTICEISHTNTSKSEEDHLSIRSHCADSNLVSYLNASSAGSEEVAAVTECHCAEDLPSSTALPVSCNSTDWSSEKDTMPESVREKWTLEDTSDIQTKSASETQRKDTGRTCGENESHQNRDSTVAQSTRMQTPPPVKEVSDGVDTAATTSSCGLEGKLAALELGKGRDSANHSPAEVMLASPSASSYSDEGSSDSGKGCSDLATPPSRTPASGSSVSGDATALSVYEFVLPQHLVGRLIGRHGAFVHQIKAKTNASILIKRHPDTSKLKICAVEGTQLDIESALEMVRKKFPLKHYPSITLEQVCFVPPVPVYPVLPECLQLMLVEGVSNDVILSSLVTPGHFFLQQPTHPTFPALNRLNACMNVCYSEPNVPLLPTPIDPGVICAAPTMGGWYRAQVVSVEPETNMCEVKFVDYGGYLSLEHTTLRQIRSDFMTLPFQASECFLANVVPAGGEEASWSADAAAVMEELTHGQVLQAQVCDYTEENVPSVFLYAVHCNQVVLVNQELVLRGLAEWWQPDASDDVSCV